MTFVSSDLSDPLVLIAALKGCDAVAHCAGINREIGEQTYQKVHVEATRSVIEAAQHAGAKKIVLMSFLRARPNCGRLSRSTVAITGPEELYLSEAVRRVARVTGNSIGMFREPVWFHLALARFWELTMKVPLVARAQVRILSEGVTEPAGLCNSLPADLLPTRRFTDDQIRGGLPKPGPFTLRDLRCCCA